MSGATRVGSLNGSDPESRPVLVPGGNKARMVATARKPSSKPLRKIEKSTMEAVKEEEGEGEEEKDSSAAAKSLPLSPPTTSARGTSSASRRHELLLRSNLSLNASCSSDASTDSFCSRASTGRIGRPSFLRRQRQINPRAEKLVMKLERVVLDSIPMPASEGMEGKRRCPWVTSNTDPSYVAFHDEEWGVPVHDDRKLFELLMLSGALAELTWPAVLSKRHIFREVFMDFDPLLISKFNEKKIVALGSKASSLLSEPRLRSIIENARQTLKIVEEFGTFDRYCWSFVNYKPILSRFRYPRQVPVKTPKADAISKDLMKRGFRSVSATVIYSFMQVSGMTNDHVISCFRFEECMALPADENKTYLMKADMKMEVTETPIEGRGAIDLEFPESLDELKTL